MESEDAAELMSCCECCKPLGGQLQRPMVVSREGRRYCNECATNRNIKPHLDESRIKGKGPREEGKVIYSYRQRGHK